jgi:hypothetical protein
MTIRPSTRVQSSRRGRTDLRETQKGSTLYPEKIDDLRSSEIPNLNSERAAIQATLSALTAPSLGLSF